MEKYVYVVLHSGSILYVSQSPAGAVAGAERHIHETFQGGVAPRYFVYSDPASREELLTGLVQGYLGYVVADVARASVFAKDKSIILAIHRETVLD